MRGFRACAHLAVTAVAAALLAALPAAPAAAEEVYYRPSDGVFHVEGHGWGHAHGLSQWGAEGAARIGVTATQILDQYYAGTSQATQAARTIRVLIQEDDHTDLRVRAVSGLKVRDRATNAVYTLPTGPTQWRIIQTSGGQKVQSYDGAWATWGSGGKTAWTGPMQFEGVTPIRVYFSSSAREYRGILRAVQTGTTTIDVVNVLSIEQYLYGVVPRESPASFQPEALKAQAIAARSYSSYKMDHAPSGAAYDICSTTQCQVYGGVRLISGGTTYELENPNTTNAVNATKGVVRTYGGAAIFAEFSSSNGGWSTQGSFSYLAPKADPWDKIASPHHYWTATLTAGQLESRFPSIGTFRRLRITKRDGNGEWGGRVKEVVVEGSSGSVTTTGGTIYAIETWPASSSGMRGTWFHFIPEFAASLVARGAAPTLVTPPGASTGILAVHLRNQGTVSWSASTVHLALASPAGGADSLAGGSTKPGVFVKNLSNPGATTVEPGQSARFEVRLNASSVPPGTYARSYRLRVGTGALFGPTVSWTVQVVPAVMTSGFVSVRGVVPPPANGGPPAVWRDGTVIVPRNGSTTAQVLIRNTGNVDWPLNKTVVLNTSDPRGRTSGSAGASWPNATNAGPVTAVDGVTGATAVKPGQVGVFPVTIYGNGHPAGTTLERFEVRYQGYAWVAGALPTLRVVRYDPAVSRLAEGVYESPDMRVRAYPGDRRTIVIRLRNVGGTPWPVNGSEVAATSNGRQDALRTSAWLEPTRATRLYTNYSRPSAAAVYPGEIAEYRIPIDPTNKTATTYHELFRALRTDTGVRYGPALGPDVTVSAATLAAAITRNTSGVSVPRNGTATYSVDLKNTGNTTWWVGSAMRLSVSSSPSYHSSWLHSARPTAIDKNVTRPGATTVRPGEVARFTFTLAGNGRAPGRYAETFGALWEGWRSTGLRIPITYVIV